MDNFDTDPPSNMTLPTIKGRGTVENVPHRYSTELREPVDDGWQPMEPGKPQTHLLIDSSKSILSHNDSPDLPFEQSLNPYRGCEHGCVYCYARPTHAWLGLSPGLDFETKIFAKPDAVRLLREALSKPGYRCSPIALGAATDAYQPFERSERLTRGILELLLEFKHPVTIVTKSALIERDADLWQALAAQRLAHVAISLTTLDGELARQLEPRASAPHARLRAVRTLAEAGVPVAVFVSPLIPGLNDHELEKLLAAAHEHGATTASYTLLRLPHEVAGLFTDWLDRHAPEKAARVMSVLYNLRGQRINDANFGSRMKGIGHYADLIRQRFALTCRRLGLNTDEATLDTSLFSPNDSRAPGGAQLALF